TAEGSGHKTLEGVNTNVFNVLNLDGQSVRLNTDTLNLENSDNTAIDGTGKIISETGPAGGGYGVLRWNIPSSIDNTTYIIPFGTDAAVPENLEFKYTIKAGGAGTPSSNYKTFSTYGTDFDNSFNEGLYPNITAGPYPANAWSNLPTTVNHLTDDYIQAAHRWVTDRFWIIDEENIGENNGDYTDRPQIEYVFTYLDAEIGGDNHITPENLVPQRYNHDEDKWGDWLYGVPTTITDPGTNTVTIQIASLENTWTQDMYPVWTLVDNSDPLPIELTAFEGNCNNGKIEINWTTWTETNNDFFTVERSNNGTEFEIVDIIEGSGNSNEPINYTVTDDLPYGGTSYYRLKNTDLAGKADYSEIVAVSCGTDENDFSFVNAYDVDNSNFVVEFTASDNEGYTIMLLDASGRLILDTDGVGFGGMNKVTLNAGDLARGIYIINLSNGTRTYSKRMMLR
ncbi:MAG: T9SS type A sorting domain-containing protein, partial [Bacteroidetes bacterium]|nr:T9SS type A sorting domain-containing protein [Bacteroidota bacterium]